jgi:broad specificity phosphatase PhoE
MDGGDVMAFSRRTLAFGGLVAAVALAVPFAAVADDTNLAGALRADGLVILLRHGPTFPNQADTDPLHPDNIAAQRNLNDAGKAMAGSFGDAIRRIGAPIGKVYTSLLNRAHETAVLAGFTDIEKTVDLTETSTAMGRPADIEAGRVVSSDEKNRRADALRKMLGTMPKAGTNTVIVTHKPNIIDALGNDWSDVKEGEASIFRPGNNGSYRLIARVQMDEWPRLAAER